MDQLIINIIQIIFIKRMDERTRPSTDFSSQRGLKDKMKERRQEPDLIKVSYLQTTPQTTIFKTLGAFTLGTPEKKNLNLGTHRRNNGIREAGTHELELASPIQALSVSQPLPVSCIFLFLECHEFFASTLTVEKGQSE